MWVGGDVLSPIPQLQTETDRLEAMKRHLNITDVGCSTVTGL